MMSCKGCRVLRRGCNKNCILRSCLQWIACPDDAQANATLFLAKTYGRVGLINLIASVPQPSRPEVFKSLLYDACGRVIDPINGAVGLMWAGDWARCEEAVAYVLRGEPIIQLSVVNTNISQVVHVHNYTIHNIANNEAKVNNCESFAIERRSQPPFVNYFESPQTLNFEVGSSSSSNNNNNNEVILELSLGLEPYKASTTMYNNNNFPN